MFIEVPKLGDLSWKSRRWTCQNTNSFLTSNGPIGPRWNCSLFPLMSLDRFLSSMFEGSFPDPGIGEIVISCNSHLDRSRWSNTQFIRALGWPPCPQPATLTHEHWCAAKKMETKNSQYMCFFLCVCETSEVSEIQKIDHPGKRKIHENPIFSYMNLLVTFRNPAKMAGSAEWSPRFPFEAWICAQSAAGSSLELEVETPWNWPKMRENDVKSMG